VTENEISRAIIDAAMRVHTALGPGLLEHVYRSCVAHELRKAGLKVQEEVHLPVFYDGLRFEMAFRMDLVVEEKVVVEFKIVEKLAPIHKAQLLTYLKLANKKLGLVLNFNAVHLREGIWRVVNGLPEQPSGPFASSASSAV